MQIKNLFTYWTNQAFSPGTVLKEKYTAFQSLLEQDKQAHEHMAELEAWHHDQVRVDFSAIEKKYAALSECVAGIVASLNRMHPSRYIELKDFYQKIDGYARHLFSQAHVAGAPPFCLPLAAVSEEMRALVGEKSLNLAMMNQRLALPIPAGFVITTNAFFRFIDHNQLKQRLDDRLAGIDIQNIPALNQQSKDLVNIIMQATVPPDVTSEIMDTFASTFQAEATSKRLAVRSSAVGEDGQASFAGQYRTELNVDPTTLLDAYKAVVASKYSPEALVYRINYGLTDMETPMAVLVVEMIDAKASGVMYTQAMDDTAADTLEVHAVFGLGERLVQGEAAPDIFKVLKKEAPEIIHKQAAQKKQSMVAHPKGDTRVAPLATAQQTQFSLGDTAVTTLADWGMQLEQAGDGPQDVEWCLDKAEQLVLLQSRPLMQDERHATALECKFEEIANPVLVQDGLRAASGVASGPVFVADNETDLGALPGNAVLVTRAALASHVRFMEKISAVVAETGSAAGHFASVAREFNIPMVVNAPGATRLLTAGQTVTVYADQGLVYDGAVPSLLAHPCLRRQPIADSPLARKLAYVIQFVSPLTLIDPEAPEFTPGNCRSLHDIIRFAHESGTREMFAIGDRTFGKSRGSKKLKTKIPMLIYLMDVGGGLADATQTKKSVAPEDLLCVPFEAIWRGLNHPGIQWGEFTHFNWAEYDKIVMSGGIISAESAQLASYAVLSDVYVNLNLKFGYHFVVLDTLCSTNAEENHILFRFNGGGGDDQGRSLRAAFLKDVLQRLGFDVTRTSDLVDARLAGATQSVIKDKLDHLGRLLGATRLMDMYLDEASQVAPFVEAFLAGRYHFATVEMNQRETNV